MCDCLVFLISFACLFLFLIALIITICILTINSFVQNRDIHFYLRRVNFPCEGDKNTNIKLSVTCVYLVLNFKSRNHDMFYYFSIFKVRLSRYRK